MTERFMCQVCCQEFDKRRGHNKYCSPDCRRIAENRLRQERRHENGIKRTGDNFICEGCGCETVFRGRKTKYCLPCAERNAADRHKRWRERNPSKVKDIQRALDERRKDSPKRIAQAKANQHRQSARRRSDPRLGFDHRMSQMLRSALRGRKSRRRWEALVGYTNDELFRHIERQFLSGMSWDNMELWHVDHILPKSMFKYEDEKSPDFSACWSMANLRPLWKDENIRKSAKREFLI